MTINLICDLDGVVYRGSTPIAGSREALETAASAGVNLLFCTNNSSRTREQVAAKVGDVVGFAATAEQIVGSAAAAALLLVSSKPTTFVLGGEGVVAELERVDIEVVTENAEAVVVGLDVDLTYHRLRTAAELVAQGARFVATNNDTTYPAEHGLWPGAGSILAAVEAASGRKAEVAGKPYPPMRDLLRTKLLPGPVWVIGDRPDTDLALAAAEPDWQSVLVLTGVVSDPARALPQPDIVADDLAQALQSILA
ncbi:HAD-IIA family hydrolase [soil metagenome]